MALPPPGIRRYFRDSINHGTVAKFRPVEEVGRLAGNLVNAGENTVEESHRAVIFRICSICLFFPFFVDLLIDRFAPFVQILFVRLERFSSYTCEFVPFYMRS